MPLYEFYCRSCNTKFEVLRAMSLSSEPATCPAGHPGAGRVISLVAARARDSDGTVIGGAACRSCPGGSCASCRL